VYVSFEFAVRSRGVLGCQASQQDVVGTLGAEQCRFASRPFAFRDANQGGTRDLNSNGDHVRHDEDW
jgi:hypothetical protein